MEGLTDGTEFGLRLYLLTGGVMVLRYGGESTAIKAPSLVACRSGMPCLLEAVPPPEQGKLIIVQTDLTGPIAALFLEEFSQPRVVQIEDEEPALQLAMALIATELDAPRCGQSALLNRTGDILFIGLLRHLVAHPSAHGSGLFNGLADSRIARALVAMHQRPSFDWTLERLSDEAGMSRTAFASAFRQVMQKTPGKYLAAIRLAIAQRAVELDKGLKLAAKEAGYTNTSALSRALSKKGAAGAVCR
jgi:AraC-like DNA-binding protein